MALNPRAMNIERYNVRLLFHQLHSPRQSCTMDRGKLSEQDNNTPYRTVRSMETVVVPSSYFNTPRIPLYARRNNSGTIADLPTELLFATFNLVYDDLYGHLPQNPQRSREYRSASKDRPQPRPDRDQWVTSCSMFPCAIASICPIWRDIVLSVPKFWEHLVILIDTPATPLPAINFFLSSSHNTPLEVTITRRWDTEDPINGQPELAQILAILDILRPHFHRIVDLCFDVTFSSSLPSFPSDFHGSATILERLELRCREDDGPRDLSTPEDSSVTGHVEFECPRLVRIAIDGRYFYETCKTDMSWLDKITHIDELTISHLKLRPGEFFSSYDFLLPLTDTDVNTLHIADIDLSPAPEGNDINFVRLQFLVFEDMHNSQVMDQMNHWIDPCEVSFIRCTFDHIAHPFRRFGSPEFGGWLIMEDIDQDIAPLIRLFDGYSLQVKRCPSFDDSVLDMMTATAGNMAFAWTRYLRWIAITDCPNFSIAALQRFIESRAHLPFQDDLSDGGDDDGGDHDAREARIDWLYLSGNVPSMSKVEWEWFDGVVDEFEYDLDII